MTIIVFLIDTSASMNQRAFLSGRPTLLDVAKGAVETFVKVRQRSPESRGDRYMLLTFEEPPVNIKAGWKENLATFSNELKNLQCYGMTTMGAALKHAFDVLNLNRMQTGIDTYGQGRCPYFLEPSVIVLITDGGRLSSNGGVHEEFNLPMHSPIPGSELTREPFRWDQRLFSLVLRLSGTPAVERDSGLVPSDSSRVEAMCEVTGGRSYSITSHRMLMQCIDSLVQKVQSGVVINFEKIGPDPPSVDGNIENDKELETKEWDVDERNGIRGGYINSALGIAWHSCRRLIYVPRVAAQKGFAVGFWPIPESFWPDLGASSLPARSAHPNVKFTCTSQEPMVIDNLPFDKYELEPSPLTQYILARKQPTVCWQIFVPNSSKNSEVGHPFGYLKASTNLTCVNMFVMPYNYPVLLPLLEELFKIHRCKPTNDWKTHFGNYLRTMPPYYAGPLRRALIRMGAPQPLAVSLIPDSMENSLSYLVMNNLKRAKTQAKMEYDKLCSEVISKQAHSKNTAPAETIRVAARSPFKKELISHPQLQDKFVTLRDQLNDFSGFVVGLSKTRNRVGSSYRNPFDISRSVLLDQVVRMRANFLQPSLSHTQLVDDDSAHSMPVGQMGNYQEYLKRMPPQLREIESTPVRQHMFGNPFKIDKRMMVDEADIDLVGSTSRNSKRSLPSEPVSPRQSNKRKAGPIPRDFRLRRPSTPPYASPSETSPASSPSYQNQLYTPMSPASMGGGYSNSSSMYPMSPMSPIHTPIFPSLGTTPSLPSVSPMPSPPASPLPWSMPGATYNPPSMQLAPLSPTHMGSALQDANTVSAGASSNLTSLTPDPLVQDTGGTLDYKMVNGDSKSPLDVRPRSPSPTLPYGPASSDLTHNPTYSNQVNNCISNEERQISMILHEVNSNNHYGVALNDSASKSAKINNGSVNDRNNINRPLSKQEIKDIRTHNLSVRALVYKEVRRPGKNFKPLFSHLETIQGGLDIRVPFLKEIIKESLRFKRKTLASLLEEFLKTMQNTGNCVQTNNIANHVSKLV